MVGQVVCQCMRERFNHTCRVSHPHFHIVDDPGTLICIQVDEWATVNRAPRIRSSFVMSLRPETKSRDDKMISTSASETK